MENIGIIFNQVVDFIRIYPLLHALILVLLSFVCAKIIDVLFVSVLSKIVGKTNTDIDDKIVDIVHKPIYYSFLFIGLRLSIEVFTSNISVIFLSVALFKTLAILLWSFAFFRVFFEIITWYSSGTTNNRKLVSSKVIPLFDNLGKIFIVLGAIYFIMISWGINPVGWLASAGVLGVMLGLAAKDTLANLFSGIFIMVDSPYKEGDYINLDTGERGYVRNIGIRSTRIMTRDDIEITIPNSVIANSKIINESGGPYEKERVRLSVGVSYDSDIEKVRNILFSIAKKHELVSKDFDPRVRFRSFGESALMFQLLYWIDKPELRGRSIDQLNSEVFKAFKENNVEIPYPHRTVHLKKTD